MRRPGSRLKHPAYLELPEPGKAARTVFLRHFLDTEPLREPLSFGGELDVVDNCNTANDFIHCEKAGQVNPGWNCEGVRSSMAALE